MSEHQRNDFSERLVDLAADHACGSIEPNDANELRDLDPSESARNAFEAVAAQIDSAYATTDPVPMPQGLQDRLMAAIPANQPTQASTAPELKIRRDTPDDRVSSERPTTASAASRPASPATAWFPWLVAAASLAITGVVILRPQQAAEPLSISEQRDQLIANADPDALLRYSWTATEDPAVVGEVTGELVWDEATDRGYMTISGLQVNDPTEFQYQLWIFDATRPQGELPFEGFDGLLSQRPIDGGVFDITETGEVIIPIDAKLRVRQGVAFAVTVEPPGGVVVSDRSRVPLLAIPQG